MAEGTGGENIRLIDADALKGAMNYNGGCGICFRYIDNADTIPAIPVEWLDWRIMNAKYNGIKEAADAFEFVLKCWKEQEAQDE